MVYDPANQHRESDGTQSGTGLCHTGNSAYFVDGEIITGKRLDIVNPELKSKEYKAHKRQGLHGSWSINGTESQNH